MLYRNVSRVIHESMQNHIAVRHFGVQSIWSRGSPSSENSSFWQQFHRQRRSPNARYCTGRFQVIIHQDHNLFIDFG